jgi:hypothetical protein
MVLAPIAYADRINSAVQTKTAKSGYKTDWDFNIAVSLLLALSRFISDAL